MYYEGGLLGRYEGETGVWNVTLPKTLTRASVQMVIQTPDGRWVEQIETFEAPGTPSALPISLPEPYFDGHLLSGWQPEEVQSKSPLETLANLATQLPIDAWMVAWSGFSEAEQAKHYIEMKADGAVSSALSRLKDPSLPRPDAQGVLAEMAAVPENDLAGRALAALAAADGAPDRALVSARRLLREANIDPWIRGRAALTLYLAGAPEDEVDNALGEGSDPALRLSRSLIKAPEKADIALYWQVAQSPGADALDRALAIRALARLNAPAMTKGEGSKLESGIAAVHLQPPIAAWQGHYMTRGNTASEYEQPPLADITHLPQGSILPLLVDLKPSVLPRTLACPEATPAAQRFQAIAASSQSTQAYCWVYVTDPKIDLSVHLTDPLGNDAGQQTVTVTVDAPRSTQLSDPMSLDERLDWVQRLAEAGEVSMFDPLDQLARVEGLSPEMATVLARTRLDLARKVINYDKILTAFETLRERDPAADLSLEVAYDVTRAYAAAGEHRRALSASKLVLDVSFSQNLEPVRELQHLGMELSAAKLLKEMIAEQPDLPTVQQGRLLLARMLLSRADDGGDTLGYTRSSLRHTAAAELSALLITDPDGPLASEIAGDLGSVLQQIGDQRRLSLLAGPLFNHYQDSASGEPLRALYAWNLLNAGLSDKALSILETADQSGQPALLRGWAYEQKGDWEKAVSAYSYAYSSEAQARLNRLYARRLSEMPLAQVENGRLLTTLAPNEKVRVRAWPLSLERLLLRDGGEVLPDQVLLDGLPGGQEHTVKADGDGHLPLPKLGTGAWLLSLATDDSTVRSIYIASPLTLEVSNGERPLIVVRQDSKPVAHATVWWFRTDGSSGRAETGADGTIWADAPITRVVAQAGSRYGLSAPTEAAIPMPAYPSPAPMEAAKRSYDFDALQSLGYIDASML